jgi:anti-sigma factor RsiW
VKKSVCKWLAAIPQRRQTSAKLAGNPPTLRFVVAIIQRAATAPKSAVRNDFVSPLAWAFRRACLHGEHSGAADSLVKLVGSKKVLRRYFNV